MGESPAKVILLIHNIGLYMVTRVAFTLLNTEAEIPNILWNANRTL